jgi:hypothetical protein
MGSECNAESRPISYCSQRAANWLCLINVLGYGRARVFAEAVIRVMSAVKAIVVH